MMERQKLDILGVQKKNTLAHIIFVMLKKPRRIDGSRLCQNEEFMSDKHLFPKARRSSNDDRVPKEQLWDSLRTSSVAELCVKVI